MPKLSKKKRKKLIGQIIEDIQANHIIHVTPYYKDFILDCFKSAVSKWSDKELLKWVGGDKQHTARRE